MIMPGRMLATLSIPGGSFSGTTQVNGYTLPVDLTLNSRTGNQPTSYVATDFIDLDDGFESGTNDDVTAYIADGAYAGGGNGSNDNAVAGGRYRYGYHNKEQDNEIKGPGNSVDFGNRFDDTRGGRWYSPDRITKPWLSPYAFAANNPINNIDPDGKDEIHFHFYTQAIIGPDGKAYGGPTTARIEIIKANGPDKFFQHNHSTEIRLPTNYSRGGEATSEKTIEFHPWNAKSTSNLTKTTAVGIPFNDPDYATLIKYATASPALKEYIKSRSQGFEATNYDKARYKGLLEDMPVYNMIGKIKQGLEMTASLLALVDAGLTLTVTSEATLPTRLARVVPERFAGGETLGRAGATDVFVTEASQLKGLKNSDEIAKKLTLLNEDGSLVKGPFRIIEFDTPAEGLAQPINRSNPGYVNGGKTAGGATEYIIPNLKIGELKNVTQKTVN